MGASEFNVPHRKPASIGFLGRWAEVSAPPPSAAVFFVAFLPVFLQAPARPLGHATLNKERPRSLFPSFYWKNVLFSHIEGFSASRYRRPPEPRPDYSVSPLIDPYVDFI